MNMHLFNFLCSHAEYQILPFRSLERKKELYKENHCFNKDYWLSVEMSIPCFRVKLSDIEDFVREEYDFRKHILPLVEKKLIYVRPWVNCFEHSSELAVESEKNHGIVSCHRDPEKGLYLNFYLGSCDPNTLRSQEDFDNIWR